MRNRISFAAVAATCALALGGLGAETAEAGPRAVRGRKAAPEVPLADIATRADLILETGLNSINADEVAKLLLDADATNDPFLLDVRERKDFLKGHLPGAVNVPLRLLAATWLKKPLLIPADRNVVVLSYYGGDGNFASFVLNCVRITDPANFGNFKWSKTMFMGMMAWNFDPALSNGHRYDQDLGTMRVDHATETVANAAAVFDAPRVPTVREKTLERAILKRADAALKKAKRPNDLQVPGTVLATALDGGLNPRVLDVRGAADYAKGHVPGAVNVAYKDVALATNTVKVDPSQPVLLYCYTGHTGSLAAAALRLLGYDAKNVLYGIDGWRPVAAVGGGRLPNFDLNRGWDFPVDDGGADDLGTFSAYSPPTGCVECHTSLTGIWYDRTVANPPAAAPVPPSLGEG